MSRRIILAVTGASGSLYAVEFLKLAHKTDLLVHGIISDAGRKVMQLELGMGPSDLDEYVEKWHNVTDFTAPMSSGSSDFHAMVILPCTMGTLAAISNGLSSNLIHRAADVTLKEQRPLLLAVRETPLNRTHLNNMLKAHDAGAIICPPMPAFYHRPESLVEMARAFAGRIGNLLNLEMPGQKRWNGPEE
ncbi:MAG: UbiX family flavin prenyltransferase [Desulfobulbaceae bacterium]|nr:UbiX family flavin prenyltransferase [Desulfobulbaceae bacterium]MCK5323785.1 UbiX family flavin prenyltransferase [Desulfobulbaceae bacterium]MCK5437148.1 UbiX family flavin prenyltransferase [Desulfobulbaceae bacterium]MCK5543770.1 UbiX family flavin prenyltransferase [Desulfobulbaceae bacterium]